jgi:hypothetical protein
MRTITKIPARQRDVGAVLRQVVAAQRASADALEAALSLLEDGGAVGSPDDLITLGEAEALSGKRPRVLRGCIRRGDLPAVRIGRDYQVKRSDVLALFAPTIAPPLARVRPVRPATEDERIAEALAAAGIVRTRHVG